MGDVLRLLLAPLDPSAIRQLQEQTRQRPTREQTPNDAAKLPLPPRGDLIKRLRGDQDVLRFNPLKPELRIVVPRPDWSIWTRLRFCWVKGRLVKRLRLPDGRTLPLPIGHARVSLCEIDRWPILIGRLPDPDSLRLRDEILDRLRQPVPLPGPIPEPFPDPIPRLGLSVPSPPLPLYARLPGNHDGGCGSASESAKADLAVVPSRAFNPQPDPPLLARLSALAAAPAAMGRATSGFALVRGASGAGVAAASGEVTATTAGSYTRFRTSFRRSFAVGDLVGPCTNAAFAARLVVDAKATNGARRLTEYDAGFTRAFALSAL